MRKRRRLADKLTIMVCAVLVAVSAFFYAPMDVSASSGSLDGIVSEVGMGNLAGGYISQNTNSFSLVNGLDNLESYYIVDLSYSLVISPDSNCIIRNLGITYGSSVEDGLILGYFPTPYYQASSSSSANFLKDVVLIAKGSDLVEKCVYFRGRCLKSSNISTPVNFNYSFNYTVNSITALTGEESASYQQGYNAGYSAGEQVGESNGYSNGYSDGFEAGEQSGYDNGFEAGEQSGYDSGFQAGQDSVDTQSYYDMGYSAGYDTGYLEGYDEGYNLGYNEGFSAGEAVGYEKGYESGWQAFKDKISGWGADTSDYPILKYSFFKDRLRLICDVFTSVPSTSYDSSLLCYLDFDIDPNHTYKFSVTTGGISGGTSEALYSSFKSNFVIGSNVFNAQNTIGNTFDFFIPGSNMGTSILFEAFVYDCVYYGGPTEEDGFLKHMGQVYPTLIDCSINVYDIGPSGDTQNHIANQTDQLTGGYNDSQGGSVNNDFSSGLNEFETAEDSLFATATTGLKDFTFFDIQSVPAMVTGMSFVGSIMSGWFTQAGGASGVGIVLSILFSIMLVAMVLGLYRWYQSKGGKD